MPNDNPYASPSSAGGPPPSGGQLPNDDQLKVEAIIKDAGQFWMAIIICLFCVGIGIFIVPVWYTIRLVQWNTIGKRYPELLDANAPAGSLAAKFRSSQWKLIVGLAFGCVMILVTLAYFVMVLLNPDLR